jgi:hypothetical protein
MLIKGPDLLRGPRSDHSKHNKTILTFINYDDKLEDDDTTMAVGKN